MLNNFSICYAVKDCKKLHTRFLRSSAFPPEKVDALQHINLLPMTIPELLSDREEVARKRLDSIYHGRIVEFVNSYDEAEQLPYIFKVMLIEDVLKDDTGASDILYISLYETLSSAEVPFFKNVTTKTLRDFYFLKIKDKSPTHEELTDLFTSKKPITAATQVSRNIYTNCNIEVARSLGIINECPPSEATNNIHNTENSINLLNAIRNDLSKNYPSDLVIPRSEYLVTDFSVDLEYSIHAKEYTKHTLLRNNIPESAKLADSITYAKSQHEIDKENENDFIKAYQQEQYISSTINTLYASSTLTPEIKINICNNDLFPITSAMGENIRSHNTKSLNKQMQDFTKAVLNKSNTMLDYISKSFNRQIKIISNFPLEWTKLDGLPLMIRHNASRVFSSPGYVREKLLLNNQEIPITLESLNTILVLSSFKSGDIISSHLRDKLEKVIRDSNNPKVRDALKSRAGSKSYISDFEPKIVFESVKSKKDIIAALNNFRYGIVIFDMHGGHAKDGDGLLELSDELLHPYDLVGKAAIPPIVILSACDTSPADRSHFNTANAFLCAGAATVLASTYPINSLEAAEYIERLYKRIRYYLPERIHLVKRSLRWSEFITGLNRRVFFEKFLKHLSKKYKYLTPGQMNSAKLQILHALEINPNRFMDDFYYLLIKITKLTKAIILNELSTHFTYCECLNYVQIGFPERIVIVAEDLIAPGQT